jgi:VIT1/CCC1 family predicted Fe2+/Mn2+ transporter|tara:strand:- start:47 stop:481 length:435 start_codon:yes stop_codon:yes gene_type:complete
MRRRKERTRAEEALRGSKAEEKEVKLIEPEKISENIQRSQEIEKPESTKTSKPNTILAQIPRYAYLIAIFALLTGVFFPLITPGVSFDLVIQGTATLFLGLVGAILLFKAAASDKRQGIFIGVGFALITISLALIFQIQQQGYF